MSNHPHMRPNGNVGGAPQITVPPQPVPVQSVVSQAEVNGQAMVMLQLATPAGLHVTFWPVEDARHLADQIRQMATPLTLGH